jgi:ADP-ribose pyrophosphatase YjhB (NUDIX family)
MAKGKDEQPVMAPILRQAARLLVIAPDSRVLLFQYEDGVRRWWAVPGGGLKGKETFEEAAAREAAEELSLAGAPLKPLWCQTVEFTFRGKPIRQVEHYYLVHLSRADVVLGESMQEEHHREGIIASRWWSLEEIERTAEEIFPVDLGQHLRRLQP